MTKENIPESDSKDSEGDFISCVVCFKKIHPRAKKCVHCNSFQDWRRYINFSSTILALIVALVSVLSISIPIIKKTLTIDNSNVILSFQSSKQGYIRVIASNSGVLAGSIGSGLVCPGIQEMPESYIVDESKLIYIDGKPYHIFLFSCIFLEEDYEQSTFVAPGESKQLRLKYNNHQMKEFVGNIGDLGHYPILLMQAIQFDGSRDEYNFLLPIKEL